MDKKMLTGLGLAEDVIDKIMAENGKDVERAKGDAAQLATELQTSKDTIASLQDAVKKFDGVDVEKLRADLAGMQQKYDTDIAQAKLDAALDLALVSAKSRDVKSVRPHLDMSMLKLDGDKLLGLEEQLSSLKTEKSFLFDTSDEKPAGITVNSGPAHGAPLSNDSLDAFVTGARQAAGLVNN